MASRPAEEIERGGLSQQHWAQEWAPRARSGCWGASPHAPATGVARLAPPLWVSDPPTAPPAPSAHLAAARRPRHPLAAATPPPASRARAPLARYDPRQAPGAGGPHAGLCAGGVG